MNWIKQIGEFLLSWPLNLYVIGISVICTLVFGFVQFRYFGQAWKSLFSPAKPSGAKKAKADMTPLQAFINTLNTNLGNGSVAGMATAIYSGGPGSAIWVVIIGVLLMAVRFAEVYLSVYYSEKSTTKKSELGGPMLYLREVIGGRYLSVAYAFFCVLFGLLMGTALQTNSIRISVQTTWGIAPIITAVILTLFMIYVVCGGAKRVVALSDKIVPVKVVVFFASTFIVLAYNYQSLLPSLKLMFSSAFSPLVLAGGLIGFTVQQAMRYGIQRSIFATESGLGTAAILYSSTGSKEPVRAGLVSMLSTFISTIVCFLIAWCIVASGVWNSGLTSTALTIASYNTAFGWLAGWVVSFLSISFGVGVLVTFVYVTRQAWLSLTGGRYENVFYAIVCAVAFAGALLDATTIFSIGDYILAGMLLINLFGIVYLIPVIKKGLASFRAGKNKKIKKKSK